MTFKRLLIQPYFASFNRPKIALWCNGSTSDSGSACEGSNPSKATFQDSNLLRNQLVGVLILYFATQDIR